MQAANTLSPRGASAPPGGSHWRAVLRHVFSVYAANATVGLLSAAAVPIALSRLGPRGYGLFALYGLLSSYMALADLGVTKNFTGLLASAATWDDERLYLRKACALYVLIAGILLFAGTPTLVVLVPTYVLRVPHDAIVEARWIVALAVLEYVAGIPIALRQMRAVAREQFAPYSRFLVVSGLLRNGFVIIAAIIYRSPVAVVAIAVIRRVCEILLARIILGAAPPGAWRPLFHFDELIRAVKGSALLSVAQVIQTTLISGGALLVNGCFGLSELGLYRAAFDFASRIWFISNGLGVVLYPAFSRTLGSQKEKTQLVRRLPTLLGASWLVFMFIAVAGASLAPPVLGALRFPQGSFVALFSLLLLGTACNAHANVAYELLQAARRFGVVATLSGLALATLTATFFAIRGATATFAIGWAWIASQSVFAAAADVVALRQAGVDRDLVWRILAQRAAWLGAALAVSISLVAGRAPVSVWIAGLVGATLLGTLLRHIAQLKSCLIG